MHQRRGVRKFLYLDHGLIAFFVTRRRCRQEDTAPWLAPQPGGSVFRPLDHGGVVDALMPNGCSLSSAGLVHGAEHVRDTHERHVRAIRKQQRRVASRRGFEHGRGA